MLILLVAVRPLDGSPERLAFTDLDTEWVVDFDLEGLIEDKVVPDVRVFFEQLIRWAKNEEASDVLWLARDSAEGNGWTDAINVLADKYIPGAEAARILFKAHTTIRPRDRRPKDVSG